MAELKGHHTKFVNKKLSAASKDYLKRQSADPYVQQAHKDGYRSRAAYKLLEALEKSAFIQPGMFVVDLGCAPGSWCQIASKLVGPKGKVVGIDLLETGALPEVTLLVGDFTSDEGLAAVQAELPEGAASKIDVVLSDMAANTVGHRSTDGLRTMGLVELAADFAVAQLKVGGTFFTKMFMNGDEKELQMRLKPCFESVKFVKPGASRKDSREVFMLALGFKGHLS